MRAFGRKIFRGLLTFLVLFLALAIVRSLIFLPLRFASRSSALPLLLGLGIGFAVFLFKLRFLRLYVFGHELTHWLAAKIFRRRTEGFKISAKGGSVGVERPNIFIVLAPYFIPIYTLLWIGVYALFRIVVERPPEWLLITFMAGIGVTYAFHLVLTGLSLHNKQTDLTVYGRPLSFAVILLGNSLILYLSLAIAGHQWHAAMKLLWTCLEDHGEILGTIANTFWEGGRRLLREI